MFGKNKKKIQDKIPIISELTGISSALLSAHFFESIDGAMAAGGFIQPVLADFLNRVLSPRQETRILTASALAVDFVDKRLKSEETLRNDGFFSEGTISRSDAVEVVDSMLFAVEDDPQEKKIQYMAHLIENASFNSSITADTACYYLKVFGDLTYRQICMINLALRRRKEILPLRDKSWVDLGGNMKIDEDAVVLQELINMHIRGYISLQFSSNRSNLPLAFSELTVIPSSLEAGIMIRNFYVHMNLHKIPDDDLVPIVMALSRKPPPSTATEQA